MVFVMKKNKIPNVRISKADLLERFALLIMVLSFAVLVLSVANVLTNKIAFNVRNMYYIMGMCSAIVCLLSAAAILVVSCFNKGKTENSHSITVYYRNQQSTLTSVLIGTCAVSLVSAAGFFGALYNKCSHSLLFNFNNPVCIGMYVSLAILMLSLAILMLKQFISPEKNQHLVILGDNSLVSAAKEGCYTKHPLIQGLNIDFSALASLQVTDVNALFENTRDTRG